MSKERQPIPEQTFLDVITEKVKEVTLQDGGHAPMLFLKGSDELGIVPIHEFPGGFEERRQIMFLLGSRVAQIDELGMLESFIFVTEAWMSKVKDGQLPDVPASQDPERLEVLIINHVEMTSKTSQMRMFEMVRNKDGELTNLKSYLDFPKDEDGRTESPLLDAFRTGYTSNRQT